MTTLADERGYIVVAPRGLGSAAPDSNRNSWSFRGSTTGLAGPAAKGASHPPGTAVAICDAARTRNFTYPSCKSVARNTCSWTQCQTDDVAYALALVKEVESKLCVDTARVFATGGLPHRGYVDGPGKPGCMPVLVITGTHDTTVPPGAWEGIEYTTTSDGSAYYYTGATAMMRRWGLANSCPYTGKAAAPFNTGTHQAECRTYCGDNAQGWSKGLVRAGWPDVLDCRAPMGHEYEFNWAWRLTLDFFDAQSR